MNITDEQRELFDSLWTDRERRQEKAREEESMRLYGKKRNDVTEEDYRKRFAALWTEEFGK